MIDEQNYYKQAAATYQSGDDYIEETELPGVLIINRPVFRDDRGFFRETFRKNDLENRAGMQIEFLQANHSRSPKNTLRGIHIAPWHKLTTCTNGQVQQIVVDTRPDSPTFSHYVSVNMGEENLRSVFIPAGCGNAFLVLSNIADYTYLTSDYWAPGKEKSFAWNDPSLNIKWQIEIPILSEKDKANPTLKKLFPEKFK